MSRTRIALLVLLFASFLVPTAPAQAASTVICSGYTTCSGKGYSHAGYASAKGTSYWNMYTGTNCTNYVAYRMVATLGLPNKRPAAGVGNARDWGKAMASVTDSTPTIGSVAWWGKTGNHVAYVEKVVSSNEIWVSESNWSGAFDWRKITRSGGSWPDGFIHFTKPALLNTTKPAVTGTAMVTSTVKASVGSWSPSGNTYAYQWLLDGAPVGGATSTSFKATSPMRGKALSVQVTASRSGYPTATVTSNPVVVAPGTLTASSPPRISGTPQVDSRLTTSPGAWSRSDMSLTYQWFVGGSPVSGATESTYVARAADVGRPITTVVTANRYGFLTATSTSSATSPVIPGTFTRGSSPTVSGTARVGSPLTASPGTWSPAADLSFQWYADGRAVDGATDATFVPSHRERGAAVFVRVTASQPGFTSASARSASTPPVATGRLRVTTAPTISGSPVVGSVLTVQPGSTSPAGASVRYQWRRDGRALSGATGSTRKVSVNDLGHRLSVTVTYKAAGFSAQSVDTAALRSARATPKVSVAATSPSTGTASFRIRISSASVASPGGRVTVRDAQGRTRTVRVVRGRSTVELTKQPAGRQTYQITYRGTSVLLSVTRDKSVTVR